MPTWGEILAELKESANARGGQPDFDGIRRRYLVELNQHTGRSVILYAGDWLSGSSPAISITLEDVHGLMEVFRDLPGPHLDLILHSPGGSAEATASILKYLRTKFSDIRVFVPLAAMSAGTMLALGSDRINMGKHSQLGPIDPQVYRPQEGRFAPARAIVEQFERIQQECSEDPSRLSAWYPIIQQYGTSLVTECENHEHLAKRLVSEWLESYMLAGEEDAADKSETIATWFADYNAHQSHGLGIDRRAAAEQGVVVENLEDDPHLQDLVLSVFHAAMHTFNGAAVKIIENNFGRAFVKMEQPISLPQAQGQPQGY